MVVVDDVTYLSLLFVKIRSQAVNEKTLSNLKGSVSTWYGCIMYPKTTDGRLQNSQRESLESS